MSKVSINTIGCKLNFAESSALLNLFKSQGFINVENDEQADVCVINTCSVTETAEKECRQLVRKLLRKNPDAFIIVTGCYAQLRPEEIKNIKGVDVILGSDEKLRLFDYVSSFSKNDEAQIYVGKGSEIHNIYGAFTDFSTERTRAFLKIQDGCDYKCTYCTIPMARGYSRSLSLEAVLRQFRFLLEQNYKEIVLTGVNVGDYGKGVSSNLFRLLSEMIKIDGDYRIRISSIEPNLLSDDIIYLVRDNEKLCKHFHIPLQSGSDKILKLMNRCYKSSLYQNLVEKIKNVIPECGIGVDVITGFPGETEEDFKISKEFIENLPVSYLHVFSFSERPGTKAINLSNKVDKRLIKERTNRLRELSIRKRNEFFISQKDKIHRVLFESYEEDNLIKGFSSNYIRFVLSGNKIEENSFQNVKIDKIQNDFCIGSII